MELSCYFVIFSLLRFSMAMFDEINKETYWKNDKGEILHIIFEGSYSHTSFDSTIGESALTGSILYNNNDAAMLNGLAVPNTGMILLYGMHGSDTKGWIGQFFKDESLIISKWMRRLHPSSCLDVHERTLVGKDIWRLLHADEVVKQLLPHRLSPMYNCPLTYGLVDSATNTNGVTFIQCSNADVAKHTWSNQLGSALLVESITPGGILSGQYSTTVHDTEANNLTISSGVVGRANNGSFIFGTIWGKEGKSMTLWSGTCLSCGGEKALETAWLLRRKAISLEEAEWKVTHFGEDEFTIKSKPVVKKVAASKSAAALVPFTTSCVLFAFYLIFLFSTILT